MFHGYGNLDKAIELLPDKDRDDFKYFTRNENSFARGNMFISNSKKLINDYFENVFEWLLKCEKIFGFNLEGYGQIRMYTFLAERYLPFWFKKYSKTINFTTDVFPERIIPTSNLRGAFLVMTHSHANDFNIIEELLRYRSKNYIGRIGSKTKTVARKKY